MKKANDDSKWTEYDGFFIWGFVGLILSYIIRLYYQLDLSLGESKTFGLCGAMICGCLYGIYASIRFMLSGKKWIGKLLGYTGGLLIGILIPVSYLQPQSFLGIVISDVGDFVFVYIVSPLLIIFCIVALCFIFAPKFVKEKIFQRNRKKETIGIVVEDDFSILEVENDTKDVKNMDRED